MKFHLLLLVFAFSTSCFLANNASGQQNVFVDFDSETDGDDHVYTTAERDEILSRMAQDYSRFNFSFTQVQPTSGDFSTLTINDGEEFGLAEHIDPRNVDKNDTATISVNSGASTSDEFITLTANVASHELGHLLGLRHFDSFGPIGSGLDPNTFTDDIAPEYIGPSNADETARHLMESDNLFVEDVVDQFFSERSAIKLAFNEQGTVIQESGSGNDSVATAEQFDLSPILVPNTIEAGDLSGVGDFDVDAIAIIGSLGINGAEDYFQFDALAGDLINIELQSDSLRTNPNEFDTTLRLLDSNGGEIDYFGVDAFNDDELETFDSILIDLVLPSDGQYVVEVGSFQNQTGDYELFVTRFNGAIAVPEPSSFAGLLLFGVVGLVRRKRS